MNNALSSFKPRRHVSVRAQITASLREMLLDGRLKEGDRLPSSQELASLWQAQEPTVHRALTPLVKEGLLERTPKVGTFVRRREERLTQIGIYAPGDLWRNSAYAFGRALCNELHEAMAGDGIAESIWVDPRPNAEQDQPWDELVRAAAVRAQRQPEMNGREGLRSLELVFEAAEIAMASSTPPDQALR